MTYKEMEQKFKKIIAELAPEGTKFKWMDEHGTVYGSCQFQIDYENTKVDAAEVMKYFYDSKKLSEMAIARKEPTINISLDCARYLSWEENRLILLHEIAHALTPFHEHDSLWKITCLEIGGDGEQYADDYSDGSGENLSAFPYVATCPKCGKNYYSTYQGVVFCGCDKKSRRPQKLKHEYNKKSEALSETKRIFRKNTDYIRVNPPTASQSMKDLKIETDDFAEWCRNEILKDEFEFTYLDGKCYVETSDYRFVFDALDMLLISVTEVEEEMKFLIAKHKEERKNAKVPGDGVWINFDEMAFFLNDKKYVLGQSTLVNLVMGGIIINDPSGCGSTLRVKEGSVSRWFGVKLANDWNVGFYSVNTSDTGQQVRNCPLCELTLTLEDKEMKDNQLSFNFPLTMTEETLRETAGEPSTFQQDEDKEQGGKSNTLIYEHNDRSYRFKFIDNKLKEVEMIFRP